MLPSELPFPFPVVVWRDETVELIDQTLLPDRLAFRRCPDLPSLGEAIRVLAVRGAPALGVAAAWGAALSWRLALREGLGAEAARRRFETDLAFLAGTRPTAVNLFWGLDRQRRTADAALAAGADVAGVDAALQAEARAIHDEDISLGRALGAAGAALLPEDAAVLTHCNAGGLATAGYGTALGIVYSAVESGKAVHVYADETRPLLQGARLTAWELAARGIPVTLLCDGAAASLLRSGRVDAVVTGADRIARNGDTANKVGTYPLALAARAHGVPFYVAAPSSTFDVRCPDGDGIPVEQRAGSEILGFGDVVWAPTAAGAWNPAFDVTPAELVSAIVTELGVHRPPYGDSLAALVEQADS